MVSVSDRKFRGGVSDLRRLRKRYVKDQATRGHQSNMYHRYIQKSVNEENEKDDMPVVMPLPFRASPVERT